MLPVAVAGGVSARPATSTATFLTGAGGAATCAAVTGAADGDVARSADDRPRMGAGAASVSSAASEMERLRLQIDELTNAKRKLTKDLSLAKKDAEEKVNQLKVLDQKYQRLVSATVGGVTGTENSVDKKEE
jgi:hypothetical protein